MVRRFGQLVPHATIANLVESWQNLQEWPDGLGLNWVLAKGLIPYHGTLN